MLAPPFDKKYKNFQFLQKVETTIIAGVLAFF